MAVPSLYPPRTRTGVMQIEDIVLSHDARGISALQGYLPANSYIAAAEFVLERMNAHSGPALIATGFYIPGARAPETDGPPGAIALGRALKALGTEVCYISDTYTAPLLTGRIIGTADVIDFPIAGHEASRRFAQKTLHALDPSLIISIERCGLSTEGKYLSMAGKDITDHTAKIDYLFHGHPHTLGIGDGGNEIGMGNLSKHIPSVATLPDHPAATTVTKLLIASISNWGGYGLVAAISELLKVNLLPSVQWEKEVITHLVDRGAVDGISGKAVPAVDNLSLEQNAWALAQLNGHFMQP